MTVLFFVLVLSIKAVLAKRFAPEVSRRFAWRPWDRQWVMAWALVNGQLLAALGLYLCGVKQFWLEWEITAGVASYLAGHALHLASWTVNRDFRPEIIAPGSLCQHWLYRRLRHPGYLGLVYVSLGQSSLLGYWMLNACTFAYAGLLVWRILQEEKLCQRLREN